MVTHGSSIYAFGTFRLDVAKRQLVREDGAPVALTPKAFETLLCLVQRSQCVVSKDELIAAVWPGRVVEENNLNQNISTLRRTLGANGVEQRYIVTEPGRGYRFVAKVTALLDDAGEPGAVSERVPVLSPRSRATIAVLPFQPTTPTERSDRGDTLGMGMTDTLISLLGSSHQFVVRSLRSVREFARFAEGAIAAGVKLGVDAVVAGEIQRDGTTVHIHARLLEIPNGHTLWQTTLSQSVSDLPGMQAAIADQVAAALEVTLSSAALRANETRYTGNVEAYRLYLIARHHADKVTPDELRAAIGFFRQAIDLDPLYALAYACMGDTYRRLPIAGDVAPKDAFPLAKAAANKALAIDEDLAEAHATLGWAAFWFDWDWIASEREFRHAIDLNPNVAEAHLGYGHLLSNTGRNSEALVHGRRAVELDPLSPLMYTIVAGFFASAGEHAEARRSLAQALQLEPDFWIAHLALGVAALDQGRCDDALAALSKAHDSSDGSLQVIPMLACALARAGRMAEARVILDDLLERAQRGYVPPSSIAKIHNALGNLDETYLWLARACDVRDVRMSFLNRDHEWDALRSNLRFVAIAERVGLP